MSKLDKFLAFGSSFDWVTPLVDLAKDINNGDTEIITVSRYDMSVGSARRRLKPWGIYPWGVKYDDDYFYLTVKGADADRARQLLGVTQ